MTEVLTAQASGWTIGDDALANVLCPDIPAIDGRLLSGAVYTVAPVALVHIPGKSGAEIEATVRAALENQERLYAALKDAHQEIAQRRVTEADAQRYRDALIHQRNSDWVITPHDRMDAVRNIARDALTPKAPTCPD